MRLLVNKVALVTGGGSGIVRAAALIFAREGASVVVADINKENGEETVTKIKNNGGNAMFVQCDVSQASQVENMVNTAVRTFGALHCCFNNAGVSQKPQRLHHVEEKEYNRIMDTNLRSTYFCMKYEIEQMLKQKDKGGTIVNTASVAGLIGNPGGAIYAATKSGIIALTSSAAAEYGPSIRVNCVCPGGIETNILEQAPGLRNHAIHLMGQSPLQRVGKPEEVAEMVAWLLSSRASLVTGVAVPVDGGFLCVKA